MISTKQTKEYQLNSTTKVIVTSKKDKDANIYRTRFTLVHDTADTKPMSLATVEDIKAYLTQEVDLDEDQQNLFESGGLK